MHELGHTLGLCHRFGDVGQIVSVCPIPADWGLNNPECTRYCGVDQDPTTAMGSEAGLNRLTDIVGPTLAGIGASIVVGGLISGTPGAIVGGIIGGIVGFFGGATNADFYERDVNYHDNEWTALRFYRLENAESQK
ncbi:MAG: hypothetical protein ACXWTY_08280 [Methylobacter sp.]